MVCFSTRFSPAAAMLSTRWSRPSARPGRACWRSPSTSRRLDADRRLSLCHPDAGNARVWQSPINESDSLPQRERPRRSSICAIWIPFAARAIAAQVLAMAADGLRVLGVAQATFAAEVLPGLQHDFDFRFLGLVGLEDPIRPDVPQAIAECRAAGIRVVMMTGDHPATAMSVARQAGLGTDAPVITGTELSTLNDSELAARLITTQIFCRVQPEQKLRLVRAFRAQGDVVAMTGDGVDDAPALKAADIGVAMGARGTEVAREAAALVLLNDDFESLVTAVRYGRPHFRQLAQGDCVCGGRTRADRRPIDASSAFRLADGADAGAHFVLATDHRPACSVVFEAEPLEPDAMKAPPRRKEQQLFDSAVMIRGLCQGIGLLILLLATYAGMRFFAPVASEQDELARTLTFVVLALANLALIHTNKSWGRTRWVGPGAFGTQLSWIAFATLAMLAIALFFPPVTQLFSFVTPAPVLLLFAFGIVALSVMWFESREMANTNEERA